MFILLTLDKYSNITLFCFSGRDSQSVNRVPMQQAEYLPKQLGATNEPTMVGPAPGNFNKEDIPSQLQQLSMNPVPALNPGTDNTGYQIPPLNQKPMHQPVMGKLGQSQEGGDIQTEEDLMSMEKSSIMFLDPFKGTVR